MGCTYGGSTLACMPVWFVKILYVCLHTYTPKTESDGPYEAHAFVLTECLCAYANAYMYARQRGVER